MSPCSRSWSVSSAGGCAGPPRRTTSRPGPSPSRSRSTSRAVAGAPGALGLRQALARVRHYALPRPAPPLTAVSTPWLAAPSARSRDGGTAEQGPPRTIHPDAMAAACRTAKPRSAVARHALLWNQAAPADKSAAGTACRADSSRVRPCRDPAKLPRPSPRLSRAGVTSLLPDSVAARETEELAAGKSATTTATPVDSSGIGLHCDLAEPPHQLSRLVDPGAARRQSCRGHHHRRTRPGRYGGPLDAATLHAVAWPHARRERV